MFGSGYAGLGRSDWKRTVLRKTKDYDILQSHFLSKALTGRHLAAAVSRIAANLLPLKLMSMMLPPPMTLTVSPVCALTVSLEPVYARLPFCIAMQMLEARMVNRLVG